MDLNNASGASRLLDVVFSDRSYMYKLRRIVDLLKYMQHMSSEAEEKTFMLIRPHGFGLSIAAEAMESMLTRDDLFMDHISDFDSALNMREAVNELPKLPVLMLSFRNISASSTDELIANLIELLQRRIWEHHIKDRSSLSRDLRRCFYNLITGICERNQSKTVIIIDGFDSPMIAISRIKDPQERIEALTVYLDMLHTISRSGHLVQFCLLTGHIKFSLSSPLSNGLPYITDLSYHELTSTLFGFTYDEVRTFYSAELARIAPQRGATVQEYVQALIQSYGGFVFSDDVSQKVLNPSSVIRAIRNDGEMYTYAADADYSYLKDCLDETDDDLEWLFDKDGQDALFLDDTNLRPEDKELGSLLLHLGFVTINKVTFSDQDDILTWQYRFGTPNVEMRRLWKILTGKASSDIKDLLINERVNDADEELYDLSDGKE